MLDILNLWSSLKSQGICYFSSPSPPPIIIPPPPPPPPPMPDIGSQTKLEAERAKLAAQLRTGRTSTQLVGENNELRGGRAALGADTGGAQSIGDPGAPLYTGAILGSTVMRNTG